METLLYFFSLRLLSLTPEVYLPNDSGGSTEFHLVCKGASEKYKQTRISHFALKTKRLYMGPIVLIAFLQPFRHI